MIVRLVFIAVLLAGAGLASAQSRPPGASCDEQMRAAAVLIPRLEESRKDAEHALAHATATIRFLEAELAKLKPKAPSTPSAPGANP